MRARWFVVVLAVMCGIGLVGMDIAAAQTPAKTKVRFRLDWKPGAQHLPFYLGRDKGYYAQEGIDIEIIAGSGSADSVKTLGTRAVEMALVDALVLVQAREQQVPAVAVAAYYQRTPICLLSPAAKPIKTPQEMVGKKIGSKKGSATSQGLTLLLESNNIKPEQMQLADIGFGVQPLLVGQVDALMGFTMNEPVEAESAGMPVHELMIADYGVKAYGLTIAANERFLKEQGEVAKAFLRATKRAIEDAVKDPQGAVNVLVKAIPELDGGRELKVLRRTIPVWTSADTKANGYGWQTETGWKQTIETVSRLKLVEKAPAIADVFTTSYLK